MEKNFIRTEKFNLFFLKFRNYIDLKQFINSGGIVKLLIEKNNSTISVYLEESDIRGKYLISEFLLNELNKEEYDHLYSLRSC